MHTDFYNNEDWDDKNWRIQTEQMYKTNIGEKNHFQWKKGETKPNQTSPESKKDDRGRLLFV